MDLTAAAVAHWIGRSTMANNSVRRHLTALRSFLRWCSETGSLGHYRDTPFRRLLKSHPPTYGKAESKYAAHRMDRPEYERLIAACQDGTEAGLRDELIVRLGVSGGMRVSELMRLTVGNTRSAPKLSWIGKANKPRTAVAGPALVTALDGYLQDYAVKLGRALTDADPLLCPNRGGKGHAGEVRWGAAISAANTIQMRVNQRAILAGLPHTAVHDLKRSAAKMMHNARTPEGGHLFDLLEISDVLDHSNPKVTKDCYIGPLGNANKERAAALFG